MKPKTTQFYAAFKAHDPRFDGRIFVGVTSTGIYCRPVCRVRTHKPENCTFHPSAAAAEAAGFRPCLKCRPELAPGLAPIDSADRLARKAALRIEEDGLADFSLEALAQGLGVSSRHLRRAFVAHYGAPPVRHLQTQRLLLAKSLLTDTRLSVTDAAFAAGFGSLRRFNALFQKHYRLTPTQLRKSPASQEETITLFLGYRPPYRWDALLAFLEMRAIPGVESVSGGIYRRTVSIGEHRGWIAIGHALAKNALAATVSTALLPVLPHVLARIKNLFDTACDPTEIHTVLAGIGAQPGTRLPGCFDAFEMAVRAVLGQQITVKGARTLAARVAAAHGTPITTPFPALTHTFPAPTELLAMPQPLGITTARIRSITALARALADGAITLSPSADPEEQIQKLLALPGFGPWTAHYIAMRALAWPDAFIHTDYGVKKALPGLTPAEILKTAEAWRPWRAYATIALWQSLEEKGETQ